MEKFAMKQYAQNIAKVFPETYQPSHNVCLLTKIMLFILYYRVRKLLNIL